MTNLLKITPESNIEISVLDGLSQFSTTIKLENICESKSPVAFKVKTTAPKKYLVRPSSGAIPAGGLQEIQIISQLVVGDVKSPCDRFLIQSCIVSGNVDDISREFWQERKGDVEEKKLNVVFVDKRSHGVGSAGNQELNVEQHNNKNPEYLTHVPVQSGVASSSSNLAPEGNLRTGEASMAAVNVKSATQQMPSNSGKYETPNSELAAVEFQKKCLRLEREVQSLKNEREKLLRELKFGSANSSPRQRSITDLWHVVPVLIIGYIIAKLLGYV